MTNSMHLFENNRFFYYLFNYLIMFPWKTSQYDGHPKSYNYDCDVVFLFALEQILSWALSNFETVTHHCDFLITFPPLFPDHFIQDYLWLDLKAFSFCLFSIHPKYLSFHYPPCFLKHPLLTMKVAHYHSFSGTNPKCVSVCSVITAPNSNYWKLSLLPIQDLSVHLSTEFNFLPL